MKTKKRTMSRKALGLALSAALVLSSLPAADAQVAKAAGGGAKAVANQAGDARTGDEGDGVTASGTFGGEKDSTGAEITPDTHQWSFAAESGVLTISGEGAIPDYTSSTYTGLPWYGSKDEIKKIVFTGNVAKVGAYMFYGYEKVEELDFSAAKKLTEIGADSFNGTSALGTLTGTEELTTLGNNCFKYSGLKTVTMPKVEAVPEGACSSLESIHFQAASSFGKQAFNRCSALKEVDAPNVGSLGESVFNTCGALEAIELPELMSVTGGSVFYGCAKLQSVSFPKLATMNGNSAFMNCASLETINLPSVTEVKPISSFARNCTGLTSVNIPNAEFTTASQIFDGCASLVYVDISSAKTLSDITIFRDCAKLRRIYLKGTKLTTAPNANFYNSLTMKPDIYHLSEATKMGTYDKLQSQTTEADFAGVKAKETTLHLEQEDYDFDTPIEPKLRGNAQGAEVTYAYYTDAACKTLVDSGNPGSKPTVAGDYYVRATAGATDSAFETNSNPAAFRIYGDIPGTGYTYNNRTDILTITDASVVVTDYTSSGTASWYKPYRLTLKKIVIKDGVTLTRIGNWAFYRLTKMTSFDLPDTVTDIGEGAFCSCSSWEAESVLTAKVTTIGGKAFQDCKKLTGAMILNESITEIPEMLFYGCAGISQIQYAADKITSFGERCFYGSGVTELALPSGCTEIPAYFYAGCGNITSVTIPATVTSFGERCFADCVGLKEIAIPDGVTTLKSFCLSGTGIISIALPDSITTIERGVFSGCKDLETTEIPAVMTTLPQDCFEGCGLKKLVVPATVTQINKDVFRGLGKLEYLEFEKDDYTDDTFVGATSSETSQGVTTKYDQTFGGVSQTAMIVCDGATYELLAARGTLRKDALNGWSADDVLYKRSQLLADLETEYNAAKAEAGKLKETDYDSESWAAFKTALTEADALFVQGENTYDIITNRTAAKQSVYNAAKPFLRATYQKTLDINEADYDTDGDGADAWFDYLDQRDLALELLQKEDATLAEIIEGEKQLRRALGEIVLRPIDGPKAEVDNAIKEAQALKEADYTPESWAALQAAIKEAQDIIKDATTVTQVAEAKKKIDDAVAALVKAAAGDPTVTPGTDPSTKPSADPGTKPSADPSAKPSAAPSSKPSTAPTKDPGIQPTKNPGGVQPTKNPGGTVKTQKVSVKKVTLKKAKSAKKKTITVQWKKLSGVTGYQVQIATNKKFKKGKKTYTVKKAKTTKKTIKKLKRKKKYYVRVRAYKTVKGKKYYGKWSKVKKVKVR